MEAAEVLSSAIRLAAVEGSDSEQYWSLIRTLHGTPEKHVFDLAVASCHAGAATDRAVGADVLAQLGFMDEWTGKRPFTDETVPVLRTLLHDGDESVLTSVLHALAHHGIATANDVRELARHRSADVRYAGAHVLGSNVPGEDELKLMIDLMQDVSDKVRDWATFSLGSQCDVDTPAIRDALRQRLDDADDEVRAEAMMGLARRSDAGVGPVIVRELQSGDRGVFAIEAAEEFLARYPDDEKVSNALTKWRTGA
jgi:HEAT repeat protein